VSACASDESEIASELPDAFPSEDAYGVYARGGIELSAVTVDQGVAVTIFDDGALIPIGDRDTELVAGRPMLLRGFWTVPDDWEPRAIEGRLVLHYPDGEDQVAVRELDIEDDSVPEWFDGTFSFYVPAELVRAKTSFDLTLYEVTPPPGDALPPAVVPRLPADGTTELDPDPTPREMEVVIVPIDHQYDGGKECPDVPPVFDAERLQKFEDALFVQNPVQAVRVTAREEPLVWTESAAELSKILDALGDLRIEDDAPPWVYYYGAIEPCDWGSTEGYAGLAYLPRGTKKSEAWRRVAVGDLAESESASIETFVHEVGHNQQRRHVPCGGPKGAVADYPYRDGLTGTFGFDLLRWALYRPTAHDYMSYCGPAWMSHYGWNQVLPVSAELTSWQLASASAPAPGPGFLVGALYGDGTTRWFTRPGTPSLDPASTATMEYWRDDERVATVPMTVEQRMDGAWEMIAPLPPDAFDTLSHVRPLGAPVDEVIPRERVHTAHAPVTR
jgi:hypothetical protein